MCRMVDSDPNNDATVPHPVGDHDSETSQAGQLAETQPLLNTQPHDSGESVPDSDFEETAVLPAGNGGGEGKAPEEKAGKRRFPIRLLAFLGVLALLVIGGLSAYLGYLSGIEMRTEAEKTNNAAILQEQFNLGMEDIENQNWDRARQRFEYIIRNNPDFPGAPDQLAVVMVNLTTTATPTVMPTPTLVPTPDTRGVEERLQKSEEFLFNGDWDNTIDSLLQLRRDEPDFEAVKIDGMLYLALRNRGMDKIGKQADLEGGIYDLALAERFGPIDSEATSYLNWARLYLTGASFWELNWDEAVNYFSQIAAQLPYLRDGSGMTAAERYRKALIGLGIARLGTKPCTAIEPLQQALSMAPDEEAANALDEANRQCGGGGNNNRDQDKEQPTEEAPSTPDVEIPPTAEPTPYP